MKYNNIFGPVPSRRLGMSLGIDLIPYKTCSLNCVYCECGKTTNLTSTRKDFSNIEEIKNELNIFLKNYPELDYITFSGSGEPTLHSKIGEIINFLKKNYSKYKIALLTNGTLFNIDKNLIKEVKNVDLIVPSIDAVSQDKYEKINRPLANISAKSIIKGLISLRQNYRGKIWLEIFIIPGINDTNQEIKLFKKAINKIKPDKIQLNSLDRPGTESWITKISPEKLKKIGNKLGGNIPVEFVIREDKIELESFQTRANN